MTTARVVNNRAPLIRGVNVALGLQPLGECPAFDGNRDGMVGRQRAGRCREQRAQLQVGDLVVIDAETPDGLTLVNSDVVVEGMSVEGMPGER